MKARAILFILFVLLGVLSGISISVGEERHKTIRDLRLIVIATQRAADIEALNSILREDDIIFTYGAKINLLKRVTKPMTMIGRGSIIQLEKELNKLNGFKVDYINYNPEHWKESHTPEEEITNLLNSVRKARLLAQRHKAKLSFVTDHVLLEKFGERIAPLVDMFGIQMQRYQGESLEVFRKEAEKKVAIVRRGSKTVPVFIQLSLAPPKWKMKIMRDGTRKKVLLRDERGKKVYEPLPVEVVLKQIEAVKDIADGIAFLYHEGTRERLRKLVTELRID